MSAQFTALGESKWTAELPAFYTAFDTTIDAAHFTTFKKTLPTTDRTSLRAAFSPADPPTNWPAKHATQWTALDAALSAAHGMPLEATVFPAL